MTNAQLVKKLKARVEVFEEISGAIRAYSNLIEDKLAKYLNDITVDPADAQTAHTTEAKKQSRERYLEVILMIWAVSEP